MKSILLLAWIPALLLSACGDGVPKIEDPHNVMVDGQKMTQRVFLQKYCEGKRESATCLKVAHAMQSDATKGAVPRF